MNFIKKSKKGFALILVILIAAAMMIPVLMLLSSTIPRRTNVTGEAVSDRALVLADSTVDHILDTINTFPFTFTTPTIIDDYGNLDIATKKAQDYLISYYISQLNGGVPDISDPTGSYDLISRYGSTYLYNLDTQEYFVVWDSINGQIMNVSAVGPEGDIKTKQIKNLSTGQILTINSIYSNYKTDNLWVEIDTNTKYWPGEPDKWDIKTTAYLISKPDIKRTIEAVASRGKVKPTGSLEDLANGNWYTISSIPVLQYFSDFSGLYHTRVYFGRFETTRGMIRSDSDLYMGGWAEDPVYANGTVTDIAIDDGNKHDGRFGPKKINLGLAFTTKDPKTDELYANNGYKVANWDYGKAALTGANPARQPEDSGLQDKAEGDYYISGNAEIVFNKNGTVTITREGENPYTVSMPDNGAIYVTGTATVSGTVDGRCTVGAGNNINIGGDIVYNNPPNTENLPEYFNPDPDSLGLIALNNIVIPKSTFDANHQLQIDAAMLAVKGWFGIDSSTSLHNMLSGEYEAWWQGCQAMYSTSNAPAIVSGSQIKGYDIQHTYFDWNLYYFGPPPFYPATGANQTWVDKPEFVKGPTLDVLQSKHKDELFSTGDEDFPWSYEIDGVTYYYRDAFDLTASATATMQNTALYRITWKEQVANPVKSVNP